MSKSKSSAAKSKNGTSRSAATGRYIGERGRRATVRRPKPETTIIRKAT